jgi:hypothetical protein
MNSAVMSIACRCLVLLLLLSALSACTVSPPKNMDNICEIFREKDDWYDDAADASEEWGTSIPIMMAIMHQESRFQQKAKPPRTTILWIFPGPRKSDAYGYPQAKVSTWDWYIDSSGNWGADRDDFADAIDFIGWYNKVSHKKCGIRRDDPYHLYLAYHEGHGGFNRRTFKNKEWLKGVAKKVSARSRTYASQLKSCEKELKSSGWFFF